jgi:ribosome-binding factor A
MSLRDEKLNEVLREAAAEFLSAEAGRQSLITVTRAQVSEGGKSGVIYLSVLPEEEEEKAVAFANRHRREFDTFFNKKVKARVPHVEFMVDMGEKNRRRIEELNVDVKSSEEDEPKEIR